MFQRTFAEMFSQIYFNKKLRYERQAPPPSLHLTQASYEKICLNILKYHESNISIKF